MTTEKGLKVENKGDINGVFNPINNPTNTVVYQPYSVWNSFGHELATVFVKYIKGLNK